VHLILRSFGFVFRDQFFVLGLFDCCVCVCYKGRSRFNSMSARDGASCAAATDADYRTPYVSDSSDDDDVFINTVCEIKCEHCEVRART
jgi:hypothetical protein